MERTNEKLREQTIEKDREARIKYIEICSKDNRETSIRHDSKKQSGIRKF